MNRIIKLFAISGLLALFTACNATTPTKQGNASPVLSGIESRGELILGTSANMAPMNYVCDDGKVVGMDIDTEHIEVSKS